MTSTSIHREIRDSIAGVMQILSVCHQGIEKSIFLSTRFRKRGSPLKLHAPALLSPSSPSDIETAYRSEGERLSSLD